MSIAFCTKPQDTTGWTEARVEILKEHWGKGWSASEIAALLPGLSRNAVLGKVDRLKLTRNRGARGSGVSRPRKPAASKPKPAKPAKPAKAPTGAPYHLRRFETIAAGTDPGFVEPPPQNDSAGIQFMELTNATCRWPKGTPGHDGFCFCGVSGANLIGGRPYCREHTAAARR